MNDYDKNSPYNHYLISPCKCKGTCSLVHFECLKNYLQSKMKKINSNFEYYTAPQLNCEICKEELTLIYEFPEDDENG